MVRVSKDTVQVRAAPNDRGTGSNMFWRTKDKLTKGMKKVGTKVVQKSVQVLMAPIKDPTGFKRLSEKAKQRGDRDRGRA